MSRVNTCRKSVPSRGNGRCGGPGTAAWGDGFEKEQGGQAVMGREGGV